MRPHLRHVPRVLSPSAHSLPQAGCPLDVPWHRNLVRFRAICRRSVTSRRSIDRCSPTALVDTRVVSPQPRSWAPHAAVLAVPFRRLFRSVIHDCSLITLSGVLKFGRIAGVRIRCQNSRCLTRGAEVAQTNSASHYYSSTAASGVKLKRYSETVCPSDVDHCLLSMCIPSRRQSLTRERHA